MKKAILTIGLFSLVMILTSFTTPETSKVVVNNNTLEAAGSGSTGHVRLDAAGSGSTGNVRLDAAGSGSTGNVRLDAAGSGSTGNVRLD